MSNMDKIQQLIKDNPTKFNTEFPFWVFENEHIFNSFAAEAIKVRQRGFKHYSSRTIVEFLRHHTNLREASGGFKINDHSVPYLARLFDLMYPQYSGLFEYRKLGVKK
jgi:uncharacterized protein (DUF2461 family)